MNLRSGARVGAGILQTAYRGEFEEGVRLLLSKWTALQLAVENQWGGRDSTDKAEDAYSEILEWFYKRKGNSRVATSTRVRLAQSIPFHVVDALLSAPAGCVFSLKRGCRALRG